MDIIDFIEAYIGGSIILKIVLLLIPIIYFLVLFIKVSDNEKNTRDIYNNQMEEINLLEQIKNTLDDINNKMEL